VSNQTAEHLRAARALVERGWCRNMPAANDLWLRTGAKCADASAWCAVGAISAVTDNCASADACEEAFRRAVQTPSATFWNDMPGRTKAEVLAAFERAIAAEEAA